MKRLFIATCAHEPDEFIMANNLPHARELLTEYLKQFGWEDSDDWSIHQQDYITDD